MTNKISTNELPNFEDAFKKLDTIVAKMEGGELTLEEALKEFETGINLVRQCQQTLQQAEQRITQLLDGTGSNEN